jgi:putative membrane protein
MTKFLFYALILGLFSCTKTQGDHDAISDQVFIDQASVVNKTEIDLGNVESTKGNDEALRAFAQNIAGYHKQVQIQLMTLALGLNLVAADSMDTEHTILKNQLLDLSGRSLDSLYIHTRVQDYHAASKLFFEEMITGQNSQLRDYSASVLPQLEAYLHQADSLVAQY